MEEIRELIVTEINKNVNTEMDVEKIVKEMHSAAIRIADKAIRPDIEKTVMPPTNSKDLFSSPWGFLPGVVIILRGTEYSTKEALINKKSSEAITELADNLGETIEAYYQDFVREMKEYQI